MVTPEDCISRAQEDATFAQILLEQNSSTLNLNNVFELENASENYQQEEEEEEEEEDDDDDDNESRESHGKKTSNTRKGNWSDNQTKLLLDEVINFKEIHKTLNHQNFHKHLSEALKEHGHHFSPKQVMHRLNNLKKKLKKIKDHNSKTGNNQKTWIHYESMYEIYKEHPWLTPKNTIASDAGDIAMGESGPSRCSRKRKLDDENFNFNTKFLELQEKKLDDVRDYRAKKLEILKEFVNKQK